MSFLVRFFRVVRVTHPLTTAAFATALGVAAFMLITDAAPASGVLAPVFLLQALATSSGFAGPARRGHYDLLFTMGQSRIRIGAVHWALSALPGAVTWLSVAALEFAVQPGTPPVSLASGTMAGMFLVSTLPWAATVWLPRLTGGIAWILLIVFALSVMSEARREVTAAAVLVCPWILAGHHLAISEIGPAALAIAVALSAMAAALGSIGRADVPLETAQ